ncbi:unnamed protein product [Chilo suppressalis]|uniref:Mab-21-like HhH/H2TH-like domain-containing protein n=1 Tax=Chilo suppressalis TaxID=168631 RepID=A0ABN8AU86_CHISP|nr:unnamed protein product [Chilo suppressalis]
MGSAASAVGEVPGADLRLPTTGLKFSVNQLRSLNSYVDTLYEDDQKGRMSMETESAVESLVQRIVDGAGQRDPRFRCCHIIALHRGKKMRSRSLEYLVTLDSLPVLNSGEECRLQDGPTGYGKIRLTGRDADKWEEFLTPSGYLCRDKVVERWVELIARCATARGGSGSRVLCARAAARAVPYQYCYLQKASPTQTSSDRRLAIVEGTAWVMVRAGGAQAEAKLVLGARAAGASPSAYCTRVPITHPMALLHYAPHAGYYAVAIGPPSSVVCADRSSVWQLWNPELEANLDAHLSDLSTVARVAGALNALIDKMREGSYQGTLRVVSRYMTACSLRRRLDRCAALHAPYARAFVSAHASHHLLLVLDELVCICEHGGVAGYVWGAGRGAAAWRGARDTHWQRDAACLRACLTRLHSLAGNEEIPPTPAESLEIILFNRWENLNKEYKGSGPTYSRRQLRYLWRAASDLVKCKNMIISDNHSNFRANLIQATALGDEAVEELIHILAIMLDQARDLYVNNFQRHTFGELDRELSSYRSKKWNKLKEYYDASSACLIDAVRRDPDLRREDLKDPPNIMKNILHWLHKGAKDDKKYLGPVLKPYLDALFKCSLENAWFLEDFDSKNCWEEYDGLAEYCAAVHDGKLDPCIGLLEAAKKLTWAKTLVDFVDRFRHIDFRLVFPTGDGMAISFPVRLPSRRELSTARALTLSRRDKAEAKLRLARRCVLAAFSAALLGDRMAKPKTITRNESEEILASVKTGNYWRNSTKPDIIPSSSSQELHKENAVLPKVRRRSRRRPATSYGFPEISITNDTKTMRRKYHTLKSLVYTEEAESVKQLRERPRSAGSTVRNKEMLTRPSILETLDFINSVKDALCVEESGASDLEESGWGPVEEWAAGRAGPLSALAAPRLAALHLVLGDLPPALLRRGRVTILQELCCYLGDASEGALFALHRLARAARSRSSERVANSWKLPEPEGAPIEAGQRYRARPPDYVSGDEGPARAPPPALPPPPPPPSPPPRRSSRTKQIPHYTDFNPPKRFQQQENQLNYLEPNKLPMTNKQLEYTGIINPIYDIKFPRDKFKVKRSKSLGRSFSSKNLGLEITRYNLTLGPKSGKKTNDVVTAITGMTGETGLEPKSNFFQRYTTAEVVGDSYKISRITID